MNKFPVSLAQAIVLLGAMLFTWAFVREGLGDVKAAVAALGGMAVALWALFQKPGDPPAGSGQAATGALALIVSVAFVGFVGCAQAPKDAHDVARAGVISLAAAAKVTSSVCMQMVFDAAEHEADLGPSGMQMVLHVGAMCETTLKSVMPLLESAAAGVDVWNDAAQGKISCTLVRATDALMALEGELRAAGVSIPWELDQALQVGRFAGAACKP